MFESRTTIIICLSIISLISLSLADGVGFAISNVSNYTLIAQNANSSLYQVTVEQSDYLYPIYLIDLWGSRYQAGFDYGVMLGEASVYNYNTLAHSLLGDGFKDQLLIDTLNKMLDWQWNGWLSAQVPQEYIDEINGITDGGLSIGIKHLGRYITRTITIANSPGDFVDYSLIFEREWQNRNETAFNFVLAKLREFTHRCSMFGVWGSRTVGGHLYSMRNLDWNEDTGIAKYKLLTVYHPPGGIEHVTVGYAGIWGALTGMSAAGITVAEANLEENEITFSGFPWLLRLRWIMENARDLEEGRLLWASTNNTVGFNHMIASAVDAARNSHAALALETMFNYTAYFYDDDPREQDATYTDPTTGKVSQIGFPLKEALYRTNHGYDPIIRDHYEWSQSPDSWSMQRYMMAYNGFTYYEQTKTRVGYLQAINITSIMGDKGHTAYQCQNNTDGSNVISATYLPIQGLMWPAWEDGEGETWRPAACNTYVEFDMTQWWTQLTGDRL